MCRLQTAFSNNCPYVGKLTIELEEALKLWITWEIPPEANQQQAGGTGAMVDDVEMEYDSEGEEKKQTSSKKPIPLDLSPVVPLKAIYERRGRAPTAGMVKVMLRRWNSCRPVSGSER
jgi:hypothetical protein